MNFSKLNILTIILISIIIFYIFYSNLIKNNNTVHNIYNAKIIIFMIGAAILGVLIEILFFKKDSYKYYIIVLAIIFIISSIIIYKIHKNLAIFNIGGSIESILELSAFFFGGVISFIVLLISKHLRDKDNKKNNK